MNTRFSATLLAVVLACISSAAISQDATPMSPVVEFPHRHAPRPGLLTGGQPDVGAWQALSREGVTTVINLRTASELGERNERAEVEAAGLNYREVPIDGAAGITLDKARLLQSLMAEASGTVIVHCASGNRVGALLALGAADAGVPEDQAMAFGRDAGMTSAEARVRALLAQPQTP